MLGACRVEAWKETKWLVFPTMRKRSAEMSSGSSVELRKCHKYLTASLQQMGLMPRGE